MLIREVVLPIIGPSVCLSVCQTAQDICFPLYGETSLQCLPMLGTCQQVCDGWEVCKPILVFSLAQAEQSTLIHSIKEGTFEPQIVIKKGRSEFYNPNMRTKYSFVFIQ